ncbi:hypothetical protein LJ737_18605 [Hymenobacter sp. 15J16-1T3B]|uniref:hypothetical protein n=1 Tax=Hymenobacter sp. 15J16-1T3B TaxID=2886941 RepID=UPI001D11DC53|nr:hypothetical protein [Hymenobacter sp. 15J16-1T3B]MCC3159260.1 hypothetical protein [Hymenobacter sp. 15J16-1T3B]
MASSRLPRLALSAVLLLTALACWAFYPKPAADAGYMTVALYVSGTGRGELVVTAPDGTTAPQDLGRSKSVTHMRAQLLVKVNELHRQGWQVVQMTPNRIIGTFATGTDVFYEDVYLLEKR